MPLLPFLIGIAKTAVQVAVPLVIQDYFAKRKAEREEAAKCKEQKEEEPKP